MVAACSPASPSSWWPTSRGLGALFAGSAVMFTTAMVHGGAPFGAEAEVTPTEPGIRDSSVTSSPDTPHPGSSVRTAAPAALAPGQAAPWTPGAAPDWGSPLAELPVRRAPVRETPQAHVAPALSPPEHSGHPGGWRDDPASGSGHTQQPADESGGTVIDTMLGYLGSRIGG